WWIWFGLAAVTLAFCFVPHVGMRLNGSGRWVDLVGGGFQPLELAKVAAVFFLAFWFSHYEKASGRIVQGFLIPLGVISILLALIVIEVDLGTTALIGATTFVVMFVAGTNALLLGVISMLGVGGILFVATTM